VVGTWLHGGHLFLGAARMAKSAGNFFRITDLVDQGFDPLAFRYLVLQAKYRTKLSFATGALAGADRVLRQLRQRMAEWSRGEDGPAGDFEERFRAAIGDDLDLPAAMALLSELVKSDVAPGAKAGLLRGWDRVLGLDLERPVAQAALPGGAAELLSARERARAARDYAASDRLRDELAAVGVKVIDTPEGQRWQRSR
jgi:cysteinyl-tRNA synthetase